MEVGRVPSLEDLLLDFCRHLTELLLSGGFTSVVTHFLRAALFSDTVRSPIISYLKLERNAMLYFNCRSISVHNNVKILAKCLIIRLEEALDLVTYTNWIELAKVTFKNLLNIWVVTCDDLKPQVILIQLYSQKNLLLRWLELFLYANSLHLYVSLVYCSSCPILALSYTMTWSMAWVTSQFLQQYQNYVHDFLGLLLNRMIGIFPIL